MPKIEVNESLFFRALGKRCDYDTLEKLLPCAKAELDGKSEDSVPEAERVIKLDLNDTNRPDLWSTMGVARQLRLHSGGKGRDYASFLSFRGNIKDCGERVVTVDANLRDVRPFMVAFVISGRPIDELMLLDIIQTQEKLCSNFGRKRKTISMGVYRQSNIKWPVHYKAVDPDETSFIPLQCDTSMTCREILEKHPKGVEYGWIIKDCKMFPLLTDDRGEVMSMAPIINSATLGAVQVGDKDLLVELTGSEMEALVLSANIVACDFFEAGFDILPVKVCHPYDTGKDFDREVTVPFYFQPSTKAYLNTINRILGAKFNTKEVLEALQRMGNRVDAVRVADDTEFTLYPPPYRNDFLHEVDVIEDVMIGAGLNTFLPEEPHDFTIGRLSDITLLSREIKSLLVGLGYQEMIFNYLGAKKDYIDKMNVKADTIIEIANPMSENYQFVRNSILPSLLKAESVSLNTVYPHKIFEIGKVAFITNKSTDDTGTATRQWVGFLSCGKSMNYNTMAAEVSSIMYYLGYKYKVEESQDSRFILGRQATVFADDKPIGIFGELHPQILENWQITMPIVAAEFDIESLL